MADWFGVCLPRCGWCTSPKTALEASFVADFVFVHSADKVGRKTNGAAGDRGSGRWVSGYQGIRGRRKEDRIQKTEDRSKTRQVGIRFRWGLGRDEGVRWGINIE
ncbi:MAG: hypothetical protein JXN61_04780 [Sedimentisphaerales bacterium]|nr:hypothetical protein [Sedimentisphaerales bacterium]